MGPFIQSHSVWRPYHKGAKRPEIQMNCDLFWIWIHLSNMTVVQREWCIFVFAFHSIKSVSVIQLLNYRDLNRSWLLPPSFLCVAFKSLNCLPTKHQWFIKMCFNKHNVLYLQDERQYHRRLSSRMLFAILIHGVWRKSLFWQLISLLK